MEKEIILKKMKIERFPKSGVGKKMGNQVWFHKDYVNNFLDLEEYILFKKLIPSEFDFTVLRWNEKEMELAFIECTDFDEANEPIVGKALRVKRTEKSHELLNITNQQKNALIYHHKWLFVKDDYVGFNVEESKQRSIDWKTKLGINKTLSSKIGRLNFWNEWLNQEKLSTRI